MPAMPSDLDRHVDRTTPTSTPRRHLLEVLLTLAAAFVMGLGEQLGAVAVAAFAALLR